MLIAGTVLVVLSPLLAVIAVLIRLDSRGPVLFKQIRVGRDERPFQLYKLRTMTAGSDPVGVGTDARAATTRGSPASAAGCAASRSTRCRT